MRSTTLTRRGLAALGVAVLGGATLAALAPSAHAVSTFSFRGTVVDRIGRPLAGAAVSDGSASTLTAANGTYQLDELLPGSYNLRASRSDTAVSRQSVDVIPPASTQVDFTLDYLLNASLSTAVLDTSGSAASATLTVTTRAPLPGTSAAGDSCVVVTNSRTGATTAAVHAASSGGTHTWTWALSVPAGSAAGSHSLTAKAQDCATGTRLTTISSTPYQVS